MVLNIDLELLTLIFSFMSLLSSIWITVLYYKFSDLHQHPSSIFSWISLFEIGISHHTIILILGPNFIYARIGCQTLLQTLSLDSMTEDQSWHITCIINQALFTICISAMLCYNIVVCLDLIITVRNPLISGKVRMKYYHIGTILIVFIEVSCNIWNSAALDCSNDFHDYLSQILNFGNAIYLLAAYMIAGVVSMLFTCMKYNRNYLPQHSTAKYYFFRHFMYVLVFWIVWGSVVADYMEWANAEWTQYLSCGLVSLSGFILVVIRNFEKLFWEKSVSVMCCKGDLKRQGKTSEDVWNSPISNAVYKEIRDQASSCILQGVYYALVQSVMNFEEKNAGIKYSVDLPLGTKELSGRNTKFTVKIHAPGVFNKLIQGYGLEVKGIAKSIKPKNNTRAAIQVHESKGRSGSIFIYTEDNRFVLKTIEKNEKHNLIHKIFKEYVDYIQNNNSLLCKIYGVFTIKIPWVAPIYLLMLENLQTSGVIKYYDLKGSMVNRSSNAEMGLFLGPYKDWDFVQDNRKLKISAIEREKITVSAKNDVHFLMQHNIMDYSLLLFIVESSHSAPGMLRDVESSEYYNIAIIDYLSNYTYLRKAEHAAKVIRYGTKVKLCSTANPKLYGSRFLNFFYSIFESPILSRRTLTT